MKDELLIRFIDGKTTPEETEMVLKELSQDGSAAKEWMQMAQGARLAGKKPLKHIDAYEFVEKTLASKKVVGPRGRKVVRLPWIIGGIAAAAASVAIIVSVFTGQGQEEMPQNVMADVTDSVKVGQPSEVDAVVQDLDEKTIARESIADAGVVKEKPKEEVQEKPVAESVEDTEVMAGSRIAKDETTSTASKADVYAFEMIRPSKSPYKVRVKNPEKEFVFEWSVEEPVLVRLEIYDASGNLMIKEKIDSSNRYGIVASELLDKGELSWFVTAIHTDGSKHKKSGVIELVGANE